MPKLHLYRKELVSNSIQIAGKRVAFQPLAGNRGILSLDEEKPEDAVLISELDHFAERRKFGVVKITPEEYESWSKKVLSFQPSAKRKLEKLKAMPSLLKPKQSPVKAAPAVNPTPTKPSVQTAPILQQATQNPDGTPGTPVPVNVGAPTPAFVPRTAPKPDATETKPAVTK